MQHVDTTHRMTRLERLFMVTSVENGRLSVLHSASRCRRFVIRARQPEMFEFLTKDLGLYSCDYNMSRNIQNIRLSSRANARDLRFLTAFEMPRETVNPNPTKAHGISPASEGGETGSRGHLSVQVACRPRRSPTSPLGGLRGALKALSHCPRLEGSRPEPVRKNVGLG
jgi:hypothetical protein